MRWLECSTLAETEAVDAVSEVFAEWGQGVAIEEPVESSPDGEIVRINPLRPVLVKTYLPMDTRAEERRARIEQAIWHLGRLRSVEPLQVRELAEDDWANAWKDHFHVNRVARRLVIVPSWREYEALPDDIVLLLDPGMAFGTGLHPTTQLCLRALEDYVRASKTILDLGTGSGILGIAALKLGARRVVGFDIETVAIEVAADNARRNGVAEAFDVRVGTLPSEQVTPQSFDLVVANITVRALVNLQGAIFTALKPGGIAVLSGVLGDAEPEFLRLLAGCGWCHERTDQEGDWVAIVLRRPAETPPTASHSGMSKGRGE